MDALLESFINESDEMINQITELLDSYEQSGEKECFAKIFKLVHSIKDSSELFEYPHITNLTHTFERALYKVLAGSLRVDKEGGILFLKCCAVLRRMVNEIELGTTFNTDALIESLKLFSEGGRSSFADYGCVKNLAPAENGKAAEGVQAIDESQLESVEIIEIDDSYTAIPHIEMAPPLIGTQDYEQSQIVEYAESYEDYREDENAASEVCGESAAGNLDLSLSGDTAAETGIALGEAGGNEDAAPEHEIIEVHAIEQREIIHAEGETSAQVIAQQEPLRRIEEQPENSYQNFALGSGWLSRETMIEALPDTEFLSGGVYLNFVAGALDRLEDSAVRLETSFTKSELASLVESFYSIYSGGARYSGEIAAIAKAALCLLQLIGERRAHAHFAATDALLHSCEAIRHLVYGEIPDYEGLESRYAEFPYFEETFSAFVPQKPGKSTLPEAKKVQVPEKYIRYAQKHDLSIVLLIYTLEHTNASTIVDRLTSSRSVEVLKNTNLDENTLYVFAAMSDPASAISPQPAHISVLYAPEREDEPSDRELIASGARSPLLKEALFTYMKKGTHTGEILGLFDEMIDLSTTSGIESVELIERIHHHNEQLMTGGYRI